MKKRAVSFCQDFSWLIDSLKRFDRKFWGEIFKISPLELQNLYPKFAVKPSRIF
jgi:hypothetical protein